MSERVHIRSYDDMNNYLGKGAVLTIDVDGEEMNLVKKGGLSSDQITIQHYGDYPKNILNHLLGRFNLNLYVYEYPPYTEKSAITERLLKLWSGGGVS